MLKNKKILVGITGGIAAYKICTLIRLLKKADADVSVVVTPNALNFVTKLTLQSLSQNEVYVEHFDIEEYKPEHIALTDADLFVIAPASANTISKIANGICDNLLTSTACAFTKPILIAPAMNTGMWNNKFVQDNLSKLKDAGYNILEPSDGFLACGTNGVGRMREPEEIFEAVKNIFSCSNKLLGKKFLITAGGTREKIDPVRYITNSSSGKMGLALASAAQNMGAVVTLVSTFKANGFNNIVAETAQDMEKIVKEKLEDNDCVIMAAAVSDYRVKNYYEQKIKKGNGDNLTIELVKNPDILQEICKADKHPMIIGFCAETENVLDNAKLKIQKKGCDYIIANDVSRKDIGFNSDENEVYIIDKKLNVKHIEQASKQTIARKILEEIFE